MSDNKENEDNNIGDVSDVYNNNNPTVKSTNNPMISEKTTYPEYVKADKKRYLLYNNKRYHVESHNGKVSRLNRENYDDLKTDFKNTNNITNDKDPRLKNFQNYTKGPLFGGRRKSKKTKRKSLKKRRKTKRKSLKKRRRTRRR